MTGDERRIDARILARRALLGLVAVLPAALIFRGFTVDDALVTARVASNLAAGVGHRFNPGGPEVDAVTPLGFAHVLGAAGGGSPLEMLERARLLGLVAWLGAASVLGVLLPARAGVRAPVLVLLGLSAPLAAWASSGMETGVVTLLGALALVPGAPFSLAAGIAAGLRPELLPWAAVLAVGRVLIRDAPPVERLRALALALAMAVGPALLVGGLRQLWFGSPAPLAAVAKPSDLEHGLRYAFGGFIFTGLPLLLIAPLSLRRGRGATCVLRPPKLRRRRGCSRDAVPRRTGRP
jgi:hypothetical protein